MEASYTNGFVLSFALTLGAIYVAYSVALSLPSHTLLSGTASSEENPFDFKTLIMTYVAFIAALGLTQILVVLLMLFWNWAEENSKPKLNNRLVRSLRICLYGLMHGVSIHAIVIHVNWTFFGLVLVTVVVQVYRGYRSGNYLLL